MLWFEDTSTGFHVWEISWLEVTIRPGHVRGYVWDMRNGPTGKAKTIPVAKSWAKNHVMKLFRELGDALGAEEEL